MTKFLTFFKNVLSQECPNSKCDIIFCIGCNASFDACNGSEASKIADFINTHEKKCSTAWQNEPWYEQDPSKEKWWSDQSPFDRWQQMTDLKILPSSLLEYSGVSNNYLTYIIRSALRSCVGCKMPLALKDYMCSHTACRVCQLVHCNFCKGVFPSSAAEYALMRKHNYPMAKLWGKCSKKKKK